MMAKTDRCSDELLTCSKGYGPIVEKPGFKQLVGVFDKQLYYDLPSQKYPYFWQTALPSLYNNVRDKDTEERLNSFQQLMIYGQVKGMKPYLSYTIHYIYQWKIKSRCFQKMFMLQDHTGKNLSEAMQSALNLGGWKKASKYV